MTVITDYLGIHPLRRSARVEEWPWTGGLVYVKPLREFGIANAVTAGLEHTYVRLYTTPTRSYHEVISCSAADLIKICGVT
jgi:hypothetical protein